MLTSVTDPLFDDLRGLPSPCGPLQVHELLLLHPGRHSGHIAEGVSPEVSQLPDYRLGSYGQLICSTGTALAPPATHLLDALVRRFDLVDEFEAVLCPAVHTVAMVEALPACDVCKQFVARYDAYLTCGLGRRIAGFLCAPCYGIRTGRSLGAGHGQVLATWDDVPVNVMAICRVLTDRLGRTPIEE